MMDLVEARMFAYYGPERLQALEELLYPDEAGADRFDRETWGATREAAAAQRKMMELLG